ncbi:MAG: hypothetical protein L0Y71_05735 [Gemmataceae bacterium]|nr:hypothetical protein [Gemmataceae bacterium]
MSIRFKCPHCKKPLAVKDNLAGKRAACPACKKPILIPAPIAAPVDVEALAAAALADPVEAPKDDAAKPIEFNCVYCDEPVTAAPDMAGKQMPCPSCRQILKVPLPQADKPKDWRGMDKKGPVGALINLPEQLDGAWGTEVQGRVNRESLEDAGAVEILVEPVGVAGWIRRGLWAAAAVGFITLLTIGISRNKERVKEKATFEGFWKYVEGIDPKKKPHPALLAEAERLEGELLLLAQGKGEEARKKFASARATSGAKDTDIDRDFFLVDLARSQIDLGMENEDQYRAKSRVEWGTVITEVKRTLDNIKNPEVKVIAIRELASDLIARNQADTAVSLASGQFNPGAAKKGQPAPMSSQLTALLFASDKTPPLKLPDRANPLPTDLAARIGYAEGRARKGDLEGAGELVRRKGAVKLHDLEAATSVAAVLLCNADDKAAATKAAPFVADAMKIHGGQSYPAWHTLQLCRAAFRIPDQAATAKEYGLKLPGNFKRRAQLEWIYAQLERDDGKVSMDLVKDFPDPGGAARTLAWIALARHLGDACERPSADGDDAEHREFVKIGQLVGKRRK